MMMVEAKRRREKWVAQVESTKFLFHLQFFIAENYILLLVIVVDCRTHRLKMESLQQRIIIIIVSHHV
jgi:hypothetical protein